MFEFDTQFFSSWTYLKKPGLQGFIQQHVDAKQLIRAVTRNKVRSRQLVNGWLSTDDCLDNKVNKTIPQSCYIHTFFF